MRIEGGVEPAQRAEPCVEPVWEGLNIEPANEPKRSTSQLTSLRRALVEGARRGWASRGATDRRQRGAYRAQIERRRACNERLTSLSLEDVNEAPIELLAIFCNNYIDG